MEKKIIELNCKSLLVDVSEYPLNFLIFPHRLIANAYSGCQHDCSYCYARWYCKQDELRVKINAPEMLRKELKSRIKRNKPKEPICFGSISDHYQPIERKYELTRKMLEVCDELNYPCYVVTKSDLIVRDKDILSSLAKRNIAAVNFTVTPMETNLLSKLEPLAPPNRKRWEAISTLTETGVTTSLYLSPIFPTLADKLLPSYLDKASQSGVKCCSAIFLKIRPIVWKYLLIFLLKNRPELVKEYEELYFKHGNKDLSGYLLPELNYRRRTMELIAKKCKQLNILFSAEEFVNLWSTPYSDCVNLHSWHAPTAYDIIKFEKSQSPKQVTIEQVIDHIKKNFQVDSKWEKMLRKYWEKTRLFSY